MKTHIHNLLKGAEKYVGDNSPAILTGVGAAGVVATAILASRATLNVDRRLHEKFNIDMETSPIKLLGYKRVVKESWKLYLPTAATGVLTLASIVCANRISSRRAAAMAAAYSLTEKAFSEYREKIVETLGENKEEAARQEILQEKVSRNPESKNEVFLTGGGESTFQDTISGRYFKSDVEAVRKAVNDINFEINNNMYASLALFYEFIGLPSTPYSHQIGWNGNKMLDVGFTPVFGENNQPVLGLDYKTWPKEDFGSCF